MAEGKEEMIVHKATRECPMTEPHSRAICGLLRLREKIQAEVDAAYQGQEHPPDTVKG